MFLFVYGCVFCVLELCILLSCVVCVCLCLFLSGVLCVGVVNDCCVSGSCNK